VPALVVYDLLGKRALVTRESARAIGDALAAAVNDHEVTLDFVGIDAVTPSFVDEVLGVLASAFRARGHTPFRVQFLRPPTRMSSKFAALGKGRGLQITEAGDRSWVITEAAASSITSS